MLINPDVVAEDRCDDMGDIGGYDIPAQSTQGQPKEKELGSEETIRGDEAHAVRPIPLPNSIALGECWAGDLYLVCDSAR